MLFNIQSAYKLSTSTTTFPTGLLWYTWFSAKWIKDDANNYANYVCVLDQSLGLDQGYGAKKSWIVKSADLVTALQSSNTKTAIETNFLDKEENKAPAVPVEKGKHMGLPGKEFTKYLSAECKGFQNN